MRITNRFRKLHLLEVFSNISRGEFFVLEALHHHHAANPGVQGMYASALAQVMESSPPAVSRTLKALEGRGFIERTVDREDRRNTYVSLTSKGEAARRETKEHMAGYMENVVREMGPEDIRHLLTLLDKLIDIMEEEIQKTRKREDLCSKS